MQSIFKHLICFSLLIFFNTAVAQNGDNSPYSRLGIGDLIDENFMSLRQMGGIGAAYADPYTNNIVNPASYASLKATAFDFGLYSKYSRLSDNEKTDDLWSGRLEYIALAFPLSNPLNKILDRVKRNVDLGMSFALMPHSIVSYDISATTEEENIGSILRNYKGSGGSYKFYWGNAIRYKNFSFGLNLGYLFGSINYERNINFNDLTDPFNNEFTNEYTIRGFLWNAGMMYNLVLNQNDIDNKVTNDVKRLNIGIFGHSATTFNTKSQLLEENIQFVGNSIIERDTLRFSLEEKGKGKLPAEFGLGVTYHNGVKSAIGINYSISNWSNYNNDADPSTLFNGSKLTFGGFIRPNYKSYNNFFKRVYYRYGLYYKVDPRIVSNDQRLKTYGVTMGFGFPFIYQRKISHANLGLELGLKGRGTPIQESFAKILFSFTFNDDSWFLKRKYD